MTTNEKKIRQRIFKEIKALYLLKKRQQARFLPGEAVVNYAGRVYDHKELISLVDASLDFWLTAGRYTRQFEKSFARFLGRRFCAFVNSGSSANLLAVSALTSAKLGTRKLQPGDEVITTACGFPTTLNPIIQNNLVPIFIDVELGTYNISAESIERAITKKTKAIIVAHTLGNPVALDKILRIVKKYRLWFIEDNSDALGAQYRNRFTGTFGHISTCSFYPAHHITTGEGGAVLTDDPTLNTILVSLRDWGRDCWCDTGRDNTCGKRFAQQFGELPFGYDHKYVYSHIGYNLKATEMQAAIGVEQLKKLPRFIKDRKKNYHALHKCLTKYAQCLRLPETYRDARACWFGIPVYVKENAPFTRNDIVTYLEKRKISTRMLFGGNLIKQPAYAKIAHKVPGSLENTDKVMKNLFWIGVYPGLTSAMRIYIEKCFRDFFAHR